MREKVAKKADLGRFPNPLLDVESELVDIKPRRAWFELECCSQTDSGRTALHLQSALQFGSYEKTDVQRILQMQRTSTLGV